MKRNMMLVTCISERETNKGQITIGKKYMIDRLSIWIDRDGDAYGEVFGMDGYRVGDMLLRHFMPV